MKKLALLEIIPEGRRVLRLEPGAAIFSQGDPAEAVYFIESGKVKISVVSVEGKAAVLAVLATGSFVGESCLAGKDLRTNSAAALESSTLIRIEKRAMLLALQTQPGFAEMFMGSVLARNSDLEEDVCDHLFNQSEKRLVRVLLKLSRSSSEDAAVVHLRGMNHQALAEMVGTTRSRVTHFLNKFRRQGLIDYSGRTITIRAKLTELIFLQ